MPKGWGKICISTRLEKAVESQFVVRWSEFLWRIATGQVGRPGDGYLIGLDKPAHKSANDIVRRFLETSCDSLLLIDSDADWRPEVLTELRDFKEGWKFDALQAFYTRRGWPPEAIWFTKDALGRLAQNWILDETTMQVERVGTHFLLIRRSLLEKMRDSRDPEILEKNYEWFYYPRHEEESEDAAFSKDAVDVFGARLGATTHVKVGHISRVTTGWQTYMDFLEKSGQRERLRRYVENSELVAEFLGEEPEIVRAKAGKGSLNVREGLEAYLFNREGPSDTISDLSPEEARKFYGQEQSGYLYELILWNMSVLYDQAVNILRQDVHGKNVLVVGGGIGGEVEALKGRNGVVVFELPGALRDFLLWRYKDESSVQIYQEPEDLREIIAPPDELRYDFVVAIDTVEHFHPEDFESTLDKMLELTKPGGYLFFRNNFGQLDTYPMHFDHSSEFADWTESRALELDAAFEKLGVEVYRKDGDNGQDQGQG